MYSLSVPIMNKLFGEDKKNYIEELKKIGVKRVILATDSYIIDIENRKEMLTTLKENTLYLHENGFEVGAWLWTFMIIGDKSYTHITSPEGKVSLNAVCPSDKKFVVFAQDYINEIAKCGVDMILFDDDFRYGNLDCGLGCVCENHKVYISKVLKEEVNNVDLRDYIFKGGKNKYRSAFLQANRYYFEIFAKCIRQAVNEIDKDIRIGVCACMDVWDFAGITPYEISKILAGDTKPYLRLVGAPYWGAMRTVAWNNRIQDAIELERMARNWCGEDVEIVSEGDVYPRPRYNCPASFLELFDLNLRVDGRFGGIQKYTFDYYGLALYEKGYNESHLRNLNLYKKVKEIFDDKTSVGVSVFEYVKKFENAVIPKEVEGTSAIQEIFFSPASRMLAANGIPQVYNENSDVKVIFGENARYVDVNCLNNIIVDLRATEILQERGLDLGLMEVGENCNTTSEHYIEYNENVISSGVKATKIKINDKAIVKSEFILEDESKTVSSYQYQNGSFKCLVLAFNMYFNGENSYRNYCRAKQIVDTANLFFDTKLPAYSVGNPDLYLQCKQSEKSMAVAVSNCSCDHLYDVNIVLDKEYGQASFINCEGRLQGNKIIIKYLSPYTFSAFEVF